jgi:hypothetical protein
MPRTLRKNFIAYPNEYFEAHDPKRKRKSHASSQTFKKVILFGVMEYGSNGVM